jgi:GTP-binding protein
VYENRKRRISTSELNEVLKKAIEEVPPPSFRGQFLKINYITQLPTPFPLFALFCNHPDEVKEAYRNYLDRKLRSSFNFTGVPIQLSFRKK